jgi:hypothetical protein
MEKFVYDITCSKNDFEHLRTNEEFLELVSLARVLNALRFFYKTAMDSYALSGPVRARSSINSFLYAGSVLYEGFRTVEKLGKDLKSLDSYKSGFGVLLKDQTVRSFRGSVLYKMRNKFVFHFDATVAKEALKEFHLPEYKFASGESKAGGDMYFGLADEAMINYLLEPIGNEPDESLKRRYEKILQETVEVMGRFIKCAEKLMGDVLSNMGFSVKILE